MIVSDVTSVSESSNYLEAFLQNIKLLERRAKKGVNAPQRIDKLLSKFCKLIRID